MKKLIIVGMLFLLTFNTTLITFAGETNVPSVHITESTDSPENITPRADIIDWRYKNVNGVCYMRLYNYTKKQWVGDWIRC
ncbi:hypothetical protein MCG98_08100 [Ruminococcus sp. OA3]|uniref:hypothetical protein n=1 Tax=Ruminococcus sp. OA3 TaxID=2914164 RepID=UPI001F06B4B0|nr:hypothetical protein [Ruminococcus sp. OA3]MCH1982526.1 hypothetical protein [Ruminococcus sp. OA3]